MVVAINKMDEVDYSEKRYEEVKTDLSGHLKKVGFKLSKVTIVPVSGWEGDNITEKSANMGWYEGPTLLEALDSLSAPKRPTDKPLRIPVQVGLYSSVIQKQTMLILMCYCFLHRMCTRLVG
jgi:elongation factor 1-alpha